jgi:predicted nucleotidyltransferase
MEVAKNMVETLQLNTQVLIEIAKRYGLTHLAVFGSYARNQAKPGSDVDLYARFGRPVELFEVLAVKHDMEDAIGVKVDLVAEEAVILHQFVREGMVKDSIVLYWVDS